MEQRQMLDPMVECRKELEKILRDTIYKFVSAMEKGMPGCFPALNILKMQDSCFRFQCGVGSGQLEMKGNRISGLSDVRVERVKVIPDLNGNYDSSATIIIVWLVFPDVRTESESFDMSATLAKVIPVSSRGPLRVHWKGLRFRLHVSVEIVHRKVFERGVARLVPHLACTSVKCDFGFKAAEVARELDPKDRRPFLRFLLNKGLAEVAKMHVVQCIENKSEMETMAADTITDCLREYSVGSFGELVALLRFLNIMPPEAVLRNLLKD